MFDIVGKTGRYSSTRGSDNISEYRLLLLTGLGFVLPSWG